MFLIKVTWINFSRSQQQILTNAINFSQSFAKYIIQTLEIKQEKCFFCVKCFRADILQFSHAAV